MQPWSLQLWPAKERLREEQLLEAAGDRGVLHLQGVRSTLRRLAPAAVGKGKAFEELPDDWTCPVCGQPRSACEKSSPLKQPAVEESYTGKVAAHVYDLAADGEGKAFEELPEDRTCPVCGQPKSAYEESSSLKQQLAVGRRSWQLKGTLIRLLAAMREHPALPRMHSIYPCVGGPDQAIRCVPRATCDTSGCTVWLPSSEVSDPIK